MLRLADESVNFRGASKWSYSAIFFAGNGAASASLNGAGTKGNGKTVPSDLCSIWNSNHPSFVV